MRGEILRGDSRAAIDQSVVELEDQEADDQQPEAVIVQVAIIATGDKNALRTITNPTYFLPVILGMVLPFVIVRAEPPQLSLSPPNAVDSVYGEGFFEQLADLPAGVWAGPVESGYGVHVVRIFKSVPSRRPALAEVHDAVRQEWKASKAAELREKFFTRLRERYVVERRDGDAATGEPR